ncbi:hypothetical protein H311_01460, partial [Anncaliia algerae PRA109]
FDSSLEHRENCDEPFNDDVMFVCKRRKLEGSFNYYTEANLSLSTSHVKIDHTSKDMIFDATSVPLDLSKRQNSPHIQEVRHFEHRKDKKYLSANVVMNSPINLKESDVIDKSESYIASRDSENYNNMDMFNIYLNSVEFENKIFFNYLMNSVNKLHKDLRVSVRSSIYAKNAYNEFFTTLCEKYTNLQINIDEKNHLEEVKMDFQIFLNWIYENYNLKAVENKYNSSRICSKYLNVLRIYGSFTEKDLINVHIEALKSNRYKLLLKIIPGLSILLKINFENEMQGVRLQIMRYIQLIILRFEVFKFFHYNNMDI